MAAKEKKQRKKLPWWARVLIILLAVLLLFVVVSIGVIRYFVGDTLSAKGTLAMATYAGLDLPEGFCRFVLDVDRTYEGLPELLVMEDGTPVNNAAAYEARRAELLGLYEEYMYGAIPTQGFTTGFEVLETGPALDGAATRTQVKITVGTAVGSAEAMLLVYTPSTPGPHGMFVGLNFTGNTAVWDDESILPSFAQKPADSYGGEAASWPVEQILAGGYGVATMYYGDWAADNADTYRERLLWLFGEETHTSFTAWAFGLMRGVDYLEQMEGVNTDAIASVGHSRLARVSLWAGANDARIALVTASCGGGYLRSPLFARITTQSTSNHWFTPAYFTYEGNDAALPVDIHMLYALVADRHLYISMGRSDLASDPVATYDALQNAKAVWRDIYGRGVIPDGSYETLEPDAPVYSDGVAVHVHYGGHEMNSFDWVAYMRYMDAYVA